MLRQNIKHIKTGLLSILVLISFFLSYLLWNGNWRNTTEAGFATTSTLSASDFPRATEAASPYQILLSSSKLKKAAIILPSESSYEQWLTELSSIHLSDFHSVSHLPVHTFSQVKFEFTQMLDKSYILKWLPNLSSAELPVRGQSILLYTLNQTSPVFISIQGDTTTYIGQTDLNASDLTQSITDAISRSPWVSLNGQGNDYVPASKYVMDKTTWKISYTSVLPLVHSFFVNPQILTRIQENTNTVLWTDGSRAVQWDKLSQLLTFEDPNINDHNLYQQSDLDTAMAFIRSHGGTPKEIAAFREDSQSELSGVSTYEFVRLLGGYPVYGTQLSYLIEVYEGHIVRFVRPLIDLSEQNAVVHENLLSPDMIRSIVNRNVKKQDLSNVELKLGYYPTIKSATITFIPSFSLYVDGKLVLIFDASTGSILSEGGQS